MSARCLCCGRMLRDSEELYHAACKRKLFGQGSTPCLNYSLDELNELAKQHVLARVSVPGVQPKLSLHLERATPRDGARLTLVGLAGDFILKPPVAQWQHLPEAEHFCMLYARRCGILTADFGLVPLKSGEYAYLSKRMDCQGGTRLHMEDFCQILNKLTFQKYSGSMEQIARGLRAYSSSPGLDMIRLYELTLFSYVTGNSDMHLKNFSLLRQADGRNELSPAYDLVPVKVILPEDTEELALTLNGKKSKLKADDFNKFATSLQLSPVQQARTTSRIVKKLTREKDDALACSFLPEDLKQKLSNLIDSRLNSMNWSKGSDTFDRV